MESTTLVARIVTRTAFRVAGIRTRTNNDDETSGRGRIPDLWKQFYSGGVTARVAAASPNRIYEVYHEYESDHTGDYSVLIGAEVRLDAVIPDDLVAITIPESRYIVTPAEGEMPKAVQQAWGRVWTHFEAAPAHERAYTVDFEEYELNAKGQPVRCDLYIAIR